MGGGGWGRESQFPLHLACILWTYSRKSFIHPPQKSCSFHGIPSCCRCWHVHECFWRLLVLLPFIAWLPPFLACCAPLDPFP